jgi:hypothetical protein
MTTKSKLTVEDLYRSYKTHEVKKNKDSGKYEVFFTDHYSLSLYDIPNLIEELTCVLDFYGKNNVYIRRQFNDDEPAYVCCTRLAALEIEKDEVEKILKEYSARVKDVKDSRRQQYEALKKEFGDA